jgi:microsomal dipeptidase-like Zn-dependent dipeptidase
MVAKVCNQDNGINSGFTELGKEVLDILLDDSNGERIFIDIKHLSALAREEYFQIRQYKDPDNNIIPVIISHGACNGLQSRHQQTSAYPELGNDFLAEDINFYDNEILEVVKTNGLFGIQLDERRIASESALKKTKNSIFRNKIMHYRSELLWKQIQYIAELLDDHDLNAWENVAIGSDYDGIVDPINSFWTIEQYEPLKSHLERHAFNYLQNCKSRLKVSANQNISASNIVNNVFQLNAWRFFERWF